MARLRAPSENGADTWRIQLKLGAAGVGGTLIVDSAAFNTVTGDIFTIAFEIMIMTVGAGGTFDAWTTVWNETLGTLTYPDVVGGAINTDLDRDLTVTGISSSALAAQQMSLLNFWAELYEA